MLEQHRPRSRQPASRRFTAETLAPVVQRHQKRLTKGTVGPGKVVADLMLGTWVMLLSRGGTSALGRAIDYEANLWRPR